MISGLLLLAGCSAWQDSDFLLGLVHAPGSFNCSVIKIAVDGAQVQVLGPANACTTMTSSYPSYSAATSSRSAVIVIAPGFTSSFAYDASGAETVFATLPQMNEGENILGLATSDVHNVVLVTNLAIYSAVSGAFVAIGEPELTLPTSGRVTGGNNTVFVTDDKSASVYSISLPPTFSSNPVSVPLPTFVSTSSLKKGPLDLQYSGFLANATAQGNGTSLIMVEDYVLYSVNPGTGFTDELAKVPDGPGYPIVNGICPDGRMFFFIDFGSLWVFDLATAIPTNKGSITLAPRVVGYPQWMMG